ncbi:transposase [Streptomyces sp. NPDC006476]|uniref:IS110 family transposase n=1 Tax=Streptomyces sp. NPDC006476 TaxID=3157175 RepID=UPI0033BF1140
MFVGCDWATETHDVTVMDNSRTPVNRWEPALTGQGIAATLAGPGRYGDPAGLLVAIGTTRGLVVDRLLAAGRPGVPVHPNAFHAMRPRWGASRAKTGAEDSDKLADYPRTDDHRLRRITPTDLKTLQLQAPARRRAGRVEAKVTAVNQREFLDRCPAPRAAAKLVPAKLEAWCMRRGYSGRRTGIELIARLRATSHAAPRLGEDTLSTLARVQVQVVRAIRTTIHTPDQETATAVEVRPYAPLAASTPRTGKVNIGQVIGEISPIPQRAETCEQFIAETGAVPVTSAAGTSHAVTFRYATNRPARVASTAFADNSRHGSDWAAKLYTDAQARKKRHPRAVRTLARAWLRVIWAGCRDGACHASAIHQANNEVKPGTETPLAA